MTLLHLLHDLLRSAGRSAGSKSVANGRLRLGLGLRLGLVFGIGIFIALGGLVGRGLLWRPAT